MAPNRGSTKKGSHGAKLGDKSKAKGGLGPNTKSRVMKSKKAPPPKQQKTKSSHGPVRKKRRVYTEKELGLPQLNMITPVGVEKPKGKKKGKIFIDDPVRTESCTFSRLRVEDSNACALAGEYDDYPSYRQCGQRRPDRE